MESPSRRNLLKSVLIAPAAAALAPAVAVIPLKLLTESAPEARAYEPRYAQGGTWFTPAEREFVDAAVARIIPSDDLGAGAREAGVADFIDHQLAGPYGRGETWYMQGPWRAGEEEQGYQLKLTPAQLYRASIREIDQQAASQYGGKHFAQLEAAHQDELLDALEKKKLKLPSVPGDTFLSMLVDNTVEGFLADPMYGGNRDFVGWKLVGFPGPRYNYVAEIGQYGKKYDMPFVSIAGGDTGVRSS